jgi:putative membrane protein
MGIADIIPGISGGTIALVTGIYDRLLRSISKVNLKFVLYFLKGDFARANENLRGIDFKLFIPLFTGIGSALLLMSNMMHFLLINFTAVTYAFFLGLILSSGILLCRIAGDLSVTNTVFLVLGFLGAFLFVEVTGLRTDHSLPIIFISGIVAVSAMILPGISGAFILIFLGQYEYMLIVLKELRFLEMLTFGLGALIGVLFISRAITHVLNKYRSFTMFFLIGLVLGALRSPYQNIVKTIDSFFPVFTAAVTGFSIVLILEKTLGRRSIAKKYVFCINEKLSEESS